jgi:hypothetical protein
MLPPLGSLAALVAASITPLIGNVPVDANSMFKED